MTVSTAVAARDGSPGGMVRQYSQDFAQVLPSHIKADTWVRLAQGALKKGKRLPGGRYELEVAASNNPGVFLASLLDAARLGLEPGTEQYYLTPRTVKGQLEILGIIGYQGLIELMYRAGAVSSVVAEVVYEHDSFNYQPGKHDRPEHIIDWDADDRGALRLTYAYAVMKDGATSKVVVLNKVGIGRIKAKSQGASSSYSPWQTNPEAMWLKSAVRQLAKWVPTSAEYIREQMRAKAEVEQVASGIPEVAAILDRDIDNNLGANDVDDDGVITGEIVEEPEGWEPR
jgi:recombination protein RecT